MVPHVPIPAFLGLFVGIWKLAIVAAVVVVFVSRSQSRFRPYLRLLRPWVEPPKRNPAILPAEVASRSNSTRGSRLYWSLTIVAAVAVAAWIVTSMTIWASGRAPR